MRALLKMEMQGTQGGALESGSPESHRRLALPWHLDFENHLPKKKKKNQIKTLLKDLGPDTHPALQPSLMIPFPARTPLPRLGCPLSGCSPSKGFLRPRQHQDYPSGASSEPRKPLLFHTACCTSGARFVFVCLFVCLNIATLTT